jgi:hypothetical protein
VSSADPGYSGDAALEMLFHESSHLFDDVLENAIAAEAKRQGMAVPEGLSHAVLFYTAGYFARQHLGPGYVMYGEAQGVFSRGGFERYLPRIRESWEPHLRGQTKMGEAIGALVGSLR